MNDGESSIRIEVSDDPGTDVTSADAALRMRAASNSDDIAFTDPPDRIERGLGQPRQVTFAEANAIADALCFRFHDSGLGEGDVIAIQAPNTLEAPLLVLGAWRAGLVPGLLPLHWRLDEIRQAFSRIKPKAVIGVGHYGGEHPAETLGEAAARQMSIRFVFAFGDDLPDGITPIDDWLAVPEVLDRKPAPQTDEAQDVSGRTAILTWAVSGDGPYPVPRTHGELAALARMFGNRLRLRGNDVVLNTYPYTGITALAGQLVAPLLTGSEVVLHLPFDFDVFVQQLENHDITYTAVPAPVIAALEERYNLRSGPQYLNRLGCVWPCPHAAASGPDLFETPMPVFDIHSFSELAVMVRERESGSDPSLLPLGKIYANDDDPSGEPVLETRVRGSVTNEEDSKQLKGTLFVRGSTVPSGPHQTQSADGEPELRPDSHSFLDTGISCVVDESLGGKFRCRKNEDVIYHGGAMVAARELDRLYGEFSEFLDAAAFVLEDAVIGERIFAAVVPRPELSPSLTRLKAFLAEKRVAACKSPDQLVIVKSIPRSGDGTVLRDRIIGQL